jgi:hypothetical protein
MGNKDLPPPKGLEPQVVDPVQAQVLICAARIAGTYVETKESKDGSIAVLRIPETPSKKRAMDKADVLVRKLVEEVTEGMPGVEQVSQIWDDRIELLPEEVDGVMVKIIKTAVEFRAEEFPTLTNLTVTPVNQTNRFSVRIPRLDPAQETSFLQTVSHINNCVRTVDQLPPQLEDDNLIINRK